MLSTQLNSGQSVKLLLVESDIVHTLENLLPCAETLLQDDHTQEGANLLAFILQHPQTPPHIFDLAEDIMLELESSICPRVIYDAKAFADHAKLTDVLHLIQEYQLS